MWSYIHGWNRALGPGIVWTIVFHSWYGIKRYTINSLSTKIDSIDRFLCKISGSRKGHRMPLVFVVTTNKTTSTYKFVFEKIKERQRAMNPVQINCDYEIAAINAAQSVFVETKVQLCWFHIKQSVIRNLSKNHLKRDRCLDRCYFCKWNPRNDLCSIFAGRPSSEDLGHIRWTFKNAKQGRARQRCQPEVFRQWLLRKKLHWRVEIKRPKKETTVSYPSVERAWEHIEG